MGQIEENRRLAPHRKQAVKYFAIYLNTFALDHSLSEILHRRSLIQAADEMTRRRGGSGRGGSGDQGGEKRQATTPVGGLYKDARRNIQGNENYDEEEEEWTTVVNSKTKSPTTQLGDQSLAQEVAGPSTATRRDSNASKGRQNVTTERSFASAVAGPSTGVRRSSVSTKTGNLNTTRNSNFRSIFVTPPPEGSWRDDIVIEVQKINGAKFIGQLGFKEAKYGIFEGCLGLDVTLIHGIRFGFSDHPVVKFKLKEKINIDALLEHEFFTLKRTFMVGQTLKTDEVDCKIRGIRNPEQTQPEDSDPSIRWVKVEWSDYSLLPEKMMSWLELYGTRAGEISEDIHPDSDSDSSPIGSGTYSVKMKLTKDIPQLIPMFGKRIRVYYRGVQKLCTNCFGAHSRLHCRNDKVRWITYVLNFMDQNPDIPAEMYGRWWQIVNEEFGEITTGANASNETNSHEEGDEVNNEMEVNAQEDVVHVRTSSNKAGPKNTGQNATNSTDRSNQQRLTREEADNLADYLDLGLSITDAREAFKKEIELAELKRKIRDNKRATNRGAISASNRGNTSRIGQWGNQSNRGLSFN